MPSEELKKNLGIDWEDEPVATGDDWGGPIDEADVYAYNIAAKKAFEEEAARDDEFAGKSAAQIEAEYRQKAAEQEAAALPARREEAARQFMIEAPEVVDSVRNGERIGQFFRAAGLRGDNPDDFHKAYKALAGRGLIQINEDRRPRTPRQKLSERDLYEMPLEQLEEMARGMK